MIEAEVAFATTRVAARRRRVPPLLVGGVLALLLLVAVAKPWAGLEPAGSPGTSPGPSRGSAVAAASIGDAAQASSSPIADVPGSADPALPGFPGPPRPGSWGISVGTAMVGTSTFEWANWSEWVPLRPVSDRPASPSPRPTSPSPDPRSSGSDCSSVPTLPAAPTVLGITVPATMSTDFSVVGWLSFGPWVEPLDAELARIDTPGRSEFAALARRDGLTFPDGRYELQILTPARVTVLDFCLNSSAAYGTAADAPDPATTAQIVRDLTGRAGTWGVGAGGDGPRLVRDEPWTDWLAIDPGPAWNGTSLTLWPDTGLCLGAPALLSHPSLLAITVPPGLVPDWTVSAWWQDGSGIRPLAGLVRQVSPPGNRGIAYLERVDRGLWPAGRYEFDVLAGDHRMSLTACINGD